MNAISPTPALPAKSSTSPGHLNIDSPCGRNHPRDGRYAQLRRLVGYCRSACLDCGDLVLQQAVTSALAQLAQRAELHSRRTGHAA